MKGKPYTAFPEAKELTIEQSDRIIEHVNWMFRRGHELGLKNFVWSYFVVTTRAFAKAHDMDEEMPVSDTVDYRHNLKETTALERGEREKLATLFKWPDE